MNKPRVPGEKSDVYLWRASLDHDQILIGAHFDGYGLQCWATMSIDAIHYLFGKEAAGIIKSLPASTAQNVILRMEFIP